MIALFTVKPGRDYLGEDALTNGIVLFCKILRTHVFILPLFVFSNDNKWNKKVYCAFKTTSRGTFKDDRGIVPFGWGVYVHMWATHEQLFLTALSCSGVSLALRVCGSGFDGHNVSALSETMAPPSPSTPPHRSQGRRKWFLSEPTRENLQETVTELKSLKKKKKTRMITRLPSTIDLQVSLIYYHTAYASS